ncbi:MAG: hypothetical protein AAGJ79_01255 [Verrucomicrobiota bacterium]
MILLSLTVNILVLLPVCLGMLANASWVVASYGEVTAGSRILLAIYLTILIASVFFLFQRDPKLVLCLLSLQIIYKLLTPVIVGTLANPVVISNVVIAILHSMTVYSIYREMGMKIEGD